MAEIIKTDLNKLFSEADKKFGKGALTFADVVPEVQVIASTGSFLLDIALECGGNPEGRILEYYGGPSGGKTSLSLLSAVEVQKMGKTAAFLDIEGTFNKNWAKKLGLDLSKLLYWQPNAGDSGDTAFEVMDLMINMGVSFIVLDSVSALVTAAEIKGEYGDAHMGQLARLMSGGLKKINNSIAKKPCTIVFINQIRKEIAIFGAYDTTSGGKALEFYSSIRLNVKRKEVIGTENDPDGFKTEIRIVKNKVGKPFKKITTNLYLGKKTIKNGYCGIDKIEEILDTAINLKIL
jgi:recombination protein RecA